MSITRLCNPLFLWVFLNLSTHAKNIAITQNSTVSLYNNNKQSAKEIKKVPRIKASARIQLLVEKLNQGDERLVH